jgi:hypothetical protein
MTPKEIDALMNTPPVQPEAKHVPPDKAATMTVLEILTRLNRIEGYLCDPPDGPGLVRACFALGRLQGDLAALPHDHCFGPGPASAAAPSGSDATNAATASAS